MESSEEEPLPVSLWSVVVVVVVVVVVSSLFLLSSSSCLRLSSIALCMTSSSVAPLVNDPL